MSAVAIQAEAGLRVTEAAKRWLTEASIPSEIESAQTVCEIVDFAVQNEGVQLSSRVSDLIRTPSRQVSLVNAIAIRQVLREVERFDRLKELFGSDDTSFEKACWFFVSDPNTYGFSELKVAVLHFQHNNRRRTLLLQSLRRCGASEVSRLVNTIFDEPNKSDADRLHELGVAARDSVLPRGTLSNPSNCVLPEGADIKALHEAINGPNADDRSRCALALALGEWGGAETVPVLAEIAESAQSSIVLRQHCIVALKNIGGPGAVRTLLKLGAEETITISESALDAIDELVTGGREDFSSAPGPRPLAGGEATIAREAAESLAIIAADVSRPRPVRRKAKEVVAQIATALIQEPPQA